MTTTTIPTIANSQSRDQSTEAANGSTASLPGSSLETTSMTANGPATCFYDKPCFVGEGFARAAATIDFWTTHHSTEDLPLQKQFAAAPVRSETDIRMFDLHMFTPPFISRRTQERVSQICLHSMLADTVEEVHGLPSSERGHYLSQLVTRWFSDGSIGWMRFRLANLLALYYSMMPTQAVPMGGFEVTENLQVHGWLTDRGIYLDLVHLSKQHDVHVEDDVAATIAFGRKEWPEDFEGLRYLPLETLSKARLYGLDGTSIDVVERDLLGDDLWGDEATEVHTV